MFKTGQPNPNSNSQPNRSKSVGAKKESGIKPQFKTLEEFSDWLDAQLLALETKHDDFQTGQSVRKFFSRG